MLTVPLSKADLEAYSNLLWGLYRRPLSVLAADFAGICKMERVGQRSRHIGPRQSVLAWPAVPYFLWSLAWGASLAKRLHAHHQVSCLRVARVYAPPRFSAFHEKELLDSWWFETTTQELTPAGYTQATLQHGDAERHDPR